VSMIFLVIFRRRNSFLTQSSLLLLIINYNGPCVLTHFLNMYDTLVKIPETERSVAE
jgi:hypothetical protein